MFLAALGLILLLTQTSVQTWAQSVAPTPAPGSAAAAPSGEVVTIERLTAKGSRLEVASVQFLTGLRPGMKVNEAAVRRAAERMADSGLVKNVGYQYQSLSSERSVELEFAITDELPLLPATIEIPDVEAEDVWAYLKGIDPVFTHELPRTQKAIAFYIRYIQRYLASQTGTLRTLKIATVITADAGGNASGIVFVPASLLGTPQFNKGNKGKRPPDVKE
jgi:hypothetical protein